MDDWINPLEPITDEGRELAIERARRVTGPDKSSHPWANVALMYERRLVETEARVADLEGRLARIRDCPHADDTIHRLIDEVPTCPPPQ